MTQSSIDGIDKLMSVLANLDNKASGDSEFKWHPTQELNSRWNQHWGNLDDLLNKAMEQNLILKKDNGMDRFIVRRLVNPPPSSKDTGNN